MLHCPFQKFAQWARCCGMQEKLCWHITFIVVQRIVFSCHLLGDWFFLTEMQKSVAYIYFFIFNLNWMFALYLLILQGRLHCIYTVSPSPLVHQYSWSVQTEFHRNWKESRFLTLGFNLWFLLMVEFFWSHQVVNRSAPFTPETFFFYQGEGFYSNQGLPRIFTRVHKGNGNNCRVKPQDCWCQHSCVLLCSICEQCLDFRIGWCEFEGKRKKMHVISDIS